MISGFEIEDDLSLIKSWSLKKPLLKINSSFGEGGLHGLFRSNLGIVQSKDGDQAAIILPVQTADGACLQITDAQNGRDYGCVSFRGSPHFSFPYAAINYLFQPTRDQGLIIFEARFSMKKYLKDIFSSVF